MKQMICQDVRIWMQALIASNQFEPPPIAFYAHLASCPICQRAIIAFAALEPQLFPQVEPINTDTYDQQLVRFIDDEQREAGSGIREQPGFWWHIVRTPSAAHDVERMLSFTLFQSEAEVVADPPARFQGWVPQPAVRQMVASFALSRDFLHVALPSQRPNFAYRGTDQDEHILIQQHAPEGYETRIGVRRQSEQFWMVQVDVRPAIIGGARVRLGPLKRQIPFDPTGHAMLPNVPADLLTHQDGPTLDVVIECYQSN